MSDPNHRRSLEESDAQTRSRWWGQGLGEGMGSQCFMGTEFLFGKMRKFWVVVQTIIQQCECA